MKIITTNIPNVVSENIEQSKIVLADNIIQNVYPLFNDIYKSKMDSTVKMVKELKRKRSLVLKEKDELKILMFEYKRQKKINKLLERIETLITSGLVYDGALKHETIILLKVINKLDNDKIDSNTQKILTTINKRFSR